MNSKRKNKSSWSVNRSGRVTATLDFIETAFDRPYKVQYMDVSKEEKHMLRDLLRSEYGNEFYKSLAIQLFKKGGLTTKQIQCIYTAHEKLQVVVS